MFKDERLEKVETVTIEWETFKKALRRNYLQESNTMFEQSHSFVLRLFPPFEKEMKAEYYESEQGRHYLNDWDQKPYHIKPELILLEGTDRGTNPFRWVEWPTEANTKNALDNEVVENNDIEDLVEESREMFWNEMKSFLPDTYELGVSTHIGRANKEVKLNWVGLDDD